MEAKKDRSGRRPLQDRRRVWEDDWGVTTILQEETSKSGGKLGEAERQVGERQVFALDKDEQSRDFEGLCGA